MSSDPASLDNLHDVVTASPVSWWPPAPGWFWALAVVAIIAATYGLREFVLWQRNRYRREALHALTTQLNEIKERPTAIAIMAELVKRTAMTAFSRKTAASLTGDDWLQFLDRTGQTQDFTRGEGRWLEVATIDPKAAATLGEPEFQRLRKVVEHWVRHHREEKEESPC